MKPNVTTNHIMVTIAPVHDHTKMSVGLLLLISSK